MHGDESFWPMGGMMVGWVLLTVLLVGLVVWLIVAYAGPRRSGDATGVARQILATRFARGELDIEEYHNRVAELR